MTTIEAPARDDPVVIARISPLPKARDVELAPDVERFMRAEIDRHSGQLEIAFRCSLSQDRTTVIKATVVGRGTSTMVIPDLIDFEIGELLLHSHPSGNPPNEDDVKQAAALSVQRGVGEGVCDNSLNTIVVLRPPRMYPPYSIRRIMLFGRELAVLFWRRRR